MLAVTAAMQIVLAVLDDGVALLADTAHSARDALTAVPLWIAVSCTRQPSPAQSFDLTSGFTEARHHLPSQPARVAAFLPHPLGHALHHA
jgi:hypothetical protein